MCKSLKGYLTVEASFIMPIVLSLYLLIILCGFYLYDRCVISQDNYLLAFRGSRFTETDQNFGKVIYGDMEEKQPDVFYLEERLEYKAQFYPFYRAETKKVHVTTDMVHIVTTGYKGTLRISKSAKRLNFIKIVEKTRR